MKKTLLLLAATALLSSATCNRTNSDPESTTAPAACALVPDAGLCNAAFVRYYFDPRDKQCKPFTWGGCTRVV